MRSRLRPDAILLIVVLVSAGFTASALPTNTITSPDDGDVFTSHSVVVTGHASGSGASLSQGNKTIFDSAAKDKLVVHPNGSVMLQTGFADDFNDNSFNTSKWSVTNQAGAIFATEENGQLNLKGTCTTGGTWGSRVWVQASTPTSVFAIATLKTFSGQGDGYASGFFLWQDNNNYVGIGEQSEPSVYGTGIQLIVSYKGTSSGYTSKGVTSANGHTYKIVYSSSARTAYLYQDQNLVQTVSISLTNPKVHFTCGARESGDTVTALWDDVFCGYQSPGRLTSTVLDTESSATSMRWVDWNATVPTNTDLTVQLRSSDLPDMTGATPWVTVPKAAVLTMSTKRYVQYMATLTSTDGMATPTFKNITLDFYVPIVRVDVRVGDDGPWTRATGTRPWNIQLTVPENESVVWAMATDGRGEFNITSIRIHVDTTPPVGSILINDGATYTDSQQVTLSLEASDRFGIERMLISNQMDFAGASWTPYDTSYSWELPHVDGEKVVYARFADRNGLYSVVVLDSIILDTHAPTGRITIEDGAAYTNRRTVRLDISAQDMSGVVDMQLSEDPTFTGAQWTAYSNIAYFDLSPQDGGKTVYAKFRDPVGHVSTTVNASIVLDQEPPVLSLVINDGAAFTNSRLAHVTISVIEANHPLEWMMLSEDSTFLNVPQQPFTGALDFLLSEGDGKKTLYARAKDVAENLGAVAMASIIVDTKPPELEFDINEGDELTNDTLVLLSIRMVVEDLVDVLEISMSSSFADATRESYSPSKSYILPFGDGEKTVYMRGIDLAGNIGPTASSTIILDTTPPTLALTIGGGATHTGSRNTSLALEADDANGVATMRLWEGGRQQPSTSEPFREDVPWVLEEGDGSKSVKARVADRAGNWGSIATDDIVLDTTPPTAMSSAKGKSGSVEIHVAWEGADTGSGVRSFDVQYQDGDGPWVDWLLETTSANATFDGSWGHSYRFRARGTDVVGNVGEYSEASGPVDLPEQWRYAVKQFAWLIILVIVVVSAVVGYSYYRWKRRKSL